MLRRYLQKTLPFYLSRFSFYINISLMFVIFSFSLFFTVKNTYLSAVSASMGASGCGPGNLTEQ